MDRDLGPSRMPYGGSKAGGKMDKTMAPIIRAPRGNQLRCKGWQQEAALRCLMNNLDPEVAERPSALVV